MWACRGTGRPCQRGKAAGRVQQSVPSASHGGHPAADGRQAAGRWVRCRLMLLGMLMWQTLCCPGARGAAARDQATHA